MHIDGWAFHPDGSNLSQENKEIYRRIKEAGTVSILEGMNGYSHKVYKGIADASVTDKEILVYCDAGNACFGGEVVRNGVRFVAKVYTD